MEVCKVIWWNEKISISHTLDEIPITIPLKKPLCVARQQGRDNIVNPQSATAKTTYIKVFKNAKLQQECENFFI
ncbi:MAG: hypothetical protein IKC04_06040 [Oscillospiraceae bacterium]|nr:hypothetical protein [Oscillospiraceae bacterium]MBR2977554.1 hypothetical protein [Oscillospiraceae bacterium]